MITAKVTNVVINPPSGANGFHVEIAWRYGTSGNFVVAASNVLVNQNGTLPVPVLITYDETINPNIQIRVTYRDAIGCTPFYQVYSGTPQSPTTTTSTTGSAGSTTTITTGGPGTTTTSATKAPTTTTTTTAAPTTTTTTVAPGAYMVHWGWTSEDPLAALRSSDTINYVGSVTITPGQASFQADMHNMPPDSYPIIRVPAAEAIKTTWFESNFNNGQIPDQVFRAAFQARGFTYYVGRIPVTFDSNPAARVTFS